MVPVFLVPVTPSLSKCSWNRERPRSSASLAFSLRRLDKLQSLLPVLNLHEYKERKIQPILKFSILATKVHLYTNQEYRTRAVQFSEGLQFSQS